MLIVKFEIQCLPFPPFTLFSTFPPFIRFFRFSAFYPFFHFSAFYPFSRFSFTVFSAFPPFILFSAFYPFFRNSVFRFRNSSSPFYSYPFQIKEAYFCCVFFLLKHKTSKQNFDGAVFLTSAVFLTVFCRKGFK